VLSFGCRTSTSVIALHPLLHLDVYPYLASFLRPVSLSRETPIGGRSRALQHVDHVHGSGPKYHPRSTVLGSVLASTIATVDGHRYPQQPAGLLEGKRTRSNRKDPLSATNVSNEYDLASTGMMTLIRAEVHHPCCPDMYYITTYKLCLG
jgi:hypothetical protein